MMELQDELEAQIDRWRGYVQRRQAIASTDVDELEDHLREQVADLQAAGLDQEEAFIVAIKRLGNIDAVSREFAREHSDRLWKQLALVPDNRVDTGAPAWRELAIVLALAVGAGVAVKAGLSWIDDPGVMARNLGVLVFPFLALYFACNSRLTWCVGVFLLFFFGVLSVVIIVLDFG